MKGRDVKIKELLAAKDHFERGQHILDKAGYVSKEMDRVIENLRADIIGLQTGNFPFVKASNKVTCPGCGLYEIPMTHSDCCSPGCQAEFYE